MAVHQNTAHPQTPDTHRQQRFTSHTHTHTNTHTQTHTQTHTHTHTHTRETLGSCSACGRPVQTLDAGLAPSHPPLPQPSFRSTLRFPGTVPPFPLPTSLLFCRPGRTTGTQESVRQVHTLLCTCRPSILLAPDLALVFAIHKLHPIPTLPNSHIRSLLTSPTPYACPLRFSGSSPFCSPGHRIQPPRRADARGTYQVINKCRQ